MRRLGIVLSILLFTSLSAQGQGTRKVIFELFTSQGCSSCPSADRLMTEIANEYKESAIVLSYHVDYWDRLGWKDVFGSPAFSERQRKYEEQIPNSGVYTPQVVANGLLQGVGSNEGFVRNTYKELASLKAIFNPLIDLKKEGENYFLRIEGELPEGVQVHILVVEDDLKVNIKRGENAGNQYTYSNVVRQFSTLSDLPEDYFQIKLNNEVVLSNAQLVVFFQKQESGEIIGGEEISF